MSRYELNELEQLLKMDEEGEDAFEGEDQIVLDEHGNKISKVELYFKSDEFKDL